MLILIGHATTPDKIKITSSAAATLDITASYADMDDSLLPNASVIEVNNAKLAMVTATTTDLVAAPTNANHRRNVREMHICNTHATLSTDVTVTLDAIDGSDYRLHKVTLRPGEALEYVEGIGFFKLENEALLNAMRYVTADFVSAVTAFADITGLTVPVLSGKNYCFEVHLWHFANAATTGPRFAINGPAMTGMRIQAIITEVGSVAAGVMNTNVADVTALDTAVQATTDSHATTPVMSILSGWINPSADGTFAVRGASEVAVAAGLTVKKGSWLHIFEVPQG